MRALAKSTPARLVCLIFLVACGGSNGGDPFDAAVDATVSTQPDQDGDGISDWIEGIETSVDTNGDGTPDYLDDDSDGDGIGDRVEGGTARSGEEPLDTDEDGTPDWRDADSDGNGVTDAIEGADDLDGDDEADFRDRDDDGDEAPDVLEIGEDVQSPVDFDDDRTPDYRDVDSDNDTITDADEAAYVDTDHDTTPDRHDADSDDDGFTDADEAGDTRLSTPPRDSDSDGAPDFRDADSDNDGISDTEERTRGTKHYLADTDGDDVTDLVEIVACQEQTACANDPLDPNSSPRTRGDFVFFEPYGTEPIPARDTLDFETRILFADVYFLMDTTSSMGGSIRDVRTSLTRKGGILDQVRAEVPDTRFGVGGFDDYPVAPYGSLRDGDRAYYNVQDITGGATELQGALDSLRTHYGNDRPEALFPALWSVSTGLGLEGLSGWTNDRVDTRGVCSGGGIGWPCFRPGAVPIVVAVTDVFQHNGPSGANAYDDGILEGHAPTYEEARAALRAANVRVIGVAVNGGGAASLQAIARDTGAVDAHGEPLVSSTSEDGVSEALITQIRTLANDTPLDISVVYEDDTSDTVDTHAAFIERIEANVDPEGIAACEAHPAADTDGDGYVDEFRLVPPGQPVCFDIVVKRNESVPQTKDVQLFRATLRVLAEGFTELDQRDIFFLVPPRIPGAGPI